MRDKRQQGFTLIEMTIVLIIISILIGGVLKGREYINDAKVSRAQQDFSQIANVVQTYARRYRALPGDDPRANRWKAVGDTQVGNGNGLIEGNWNSATATDESRLAWLHLRAAGLVIGEDTQLHMNAFDGQMGFDQDLMEMKTNLVCMNQVPFDAAEQIDRALDDGLRGEGNLRGSTTALAASASSANTYTEGNSYTLCYQI